VPRSPPRRADTGVVRAAYFSESVTTPGIETQRKFWGVLALCNAGEPWPHRLVRHSLADSPVSFPAFNILTLLALVDFRAVRLVSPRRCLFPHVADIAVPECCNSSTARNYRSLDRAVREPLAHPSPRRVPDPSPTLVGTRWVPRRVGLRGTVRCPQPRASALGAPYHEHHSAACFYLVKTRRFPLPVGRW
jgi:hypothetical protein